MSITSFIKPALPFLRAHGTKILCVGIGLGVGGLGSLAFSAGRRWERTQPKTWQEKARVVFPPLSVAAVTLSMVGVLVVRGERRYAGAMAALGLTEQALQRYKTSVGEALTKPQAQKVRDEVDKQSRDASSGTVIMTDNSEVLCLEAYSGRYFKSSVEALNKAVNEVNRDMLYSWYAPINALYRAIGLPETNYGDTVGWNNDAPIELDLRSALTEENKPYLVVDYTSAPTHDYDR